MIFEMAIAFWLFDVAGDSIWLVSVFRFDFKTDGMLLRQDEDPEKPAGTRNQKSGERSNASAGIVLSGFIDCRSIQHASTRQWTG